MNFGGGSHRHRAARWAALPGGPTSPPSHPPASATLPRTMASPSHRFGGRQPPVAPAVAPCRPTLGGHPRQAGARPSSALSASHGGPITRRGGKGPALQCEATSTLGPKLGGCGARAGFARPGTRGLGRRNGIFWVPTHPRRLRCREEGMMGTFLIPMLKREPASPPATCHPSPLTVPTPTVHSPARGRKAHRVGTKFLWPGREAQDPNSFEWQ